jgi:tRNA (guanine-N7-)-methyltransferase
VGSGKGLFLETQTQRHPDRYYIGNELAFGYARLAAFRLAKLGVKNGLMIQGDGLRLFRDWVADSSLDAVHVYFPDPWWKERHRKRRVMQASFIADIHRTLKSGGRLHFWTDVEEYYQTTCELIAAHSALVGPVFVPEPLAEHDRDYRTHFERRMRRHDHPVFRSYFLKP